MTFATLTPMFTFGRSTPVLLNALLSLSREILLPVPNGISFTESDNSALFLDRARAAGVSRVGFLRHGKTAPTPENGGIDFERQLTKQGREQAASAGVSFGTELLPFHHIMLASPAPRTMETAEIFLSTSGGNGKVQIQPVQGLYDGSVQPEGSQLFRKIGYAPLNDYVNSEHVADREASRKVLGSYAYFAMKSILDALVMDETVVEKNSKQKTLWLVGHAIYLPAAALGIAYIAKCDEASTNMILSTSTLEAEGFLIDLEQSTANYLSRQSL